jgi:hypothetical protein
LFGEKSEFSDGANFGAGVIVLLPLRWGAECRI